MAAVSNAIEPTRRIQVRYASRKNTKGKHKSKEPEEASDDELEEDDVSSIDGEEERRVSCTQTEAANNWRKPTRIAQASNGPKNCTT